MMPLIYVYISCCSYTNLGGYNLSEFVSNQVLAFCTLYTKAASLAAISKSQGMIRLIVSLRLRLLGLLHSLSEVRRRC
jgi:hypothetical protein